MREALDDIAEALGLIHRKVFTMRILAIAVAMLLVASNASAFNEIHLKKLLAVNACVSCDLSGADLRDADLRDANLRKADLIDAN